MATWDATDRPHNERILAERFGAAISAFALIDRDGHELLLNAGEETEGGHELLVGLALFRRSVAQFTAARRLASASMPQQATLLARAHFETSVALRYLVYGARRPVSFETPTNRVGRLRRANYFWAEDLRRQIYRRYALIDGRIPGKRTITPRAVGRLEEEIDGLLRTLRTDFPTQHARFGSIRARREGKPLYHDDRSWYSFGFTKRRVVSFRSLCEALGSEMAYEFLYDAYSGWQHPRGLWHDCSMEEESIDVHSPYIIDSFETVTAFASLMQLTNNMAFAKAYRRKFIPRLQSTAQIVRPPITALEPGLPPGFA